jgi:hypothetical protein
MDLCVTAAVRAENVERIVNSLFMKEYSCKFEKGWGFEGLHMLCVLGWCILNDALCSFRKCILLN